MERTKGVATGFCLAVAFFAFYRIYQVKFPFDIILPWILWFPLFGMALSPFIPEKWLRNAKITLLILVFLFLFLTGAFFNQNVSLHVFVSRMYYPYPPPPAFYLRVASIVISLVISIPLFAFFSACCYRQVLAPGNRRSIGALFLSIAAGYFTAYYGTLVAGAYALLLVAIALLLLLQIRETKMLAAALSLCLGVGFFFSRQKDVLLLWRTGSKYRVLDRQWSPYYYLNFISFNKDRCLGGVYNYLMLWIVCKDTSLIEKELRFFHAEIARGKESALVIGRADGTTLLTLDEPKPHLKRGVAVEIDPVVVKKVASDFAEYNQNIFSRPGFKAVAMDWRTFLQKDQKKYDVAVWDGLGIRLFTEPFTNFFQEDYLYTKESLKLLFEKKLKKDGIFAANWGSTQAREVYPLMANLPKGVHAIAFWTTFNDYPLMGLPVLLVAASRDKKRLDQMAAKLRQIKPFQQIPTDVDLSSWKFDDNRPFLQRFVQPALFLLFFPMLLFSLLLPAVLILREKRKSPRSFKTHLALALYGLSFGSAFTLLVSRCSRLASDGGAAPGFLILFSLFTLSAAISCLFPRSPILKQKAEVLSALTLVLSGIVTSRLLVLATTSLFGFACSFLWRVFLSSTENKNFSAGVSLLFTVSGFLLFQGSAWLIGYAANAVFLAFLMVVSFLIDPRS